MHHLPKSAQITDECTIYRRDHNLPNSAQASRTEKMKTDMYPELATETCVEVTEAKTGNDDGATAEQQIWNVGPG